MTELALLPNLALTTVWSHLWLAIPLFPHFVIFAAVVIVSHWVWLFGIKKGGKTNAHTQKSYQTGGSGPALSSTLMTSSLVAPPSSFEYTPMQSSPVQPVQSVDSETEELETEESEANGIASTRTAPTRMASIGQAANHDSGNPISDFLGNIFFEDELSPNTDIPIAHTSTEHGVARAEITGTTDPLPADQLLIERFAFVNLAELIENLEQPISKNQREEINRLALLTRQTEQNYPDLQQQVSALLLAENGQADQRVD